MKKHIFIVLLCFAAGPVLGQKSAEKEMEKVAREMFRVICVNDKEEWIKFMETYYTKALQEKPVQRKLDTKGEKDVVIMRSPSAQASPLDAKAAMFDQLHRDFGKGKITSLTTNGTLATMKLEDGGRTANLTLTFTPQAPWLIDALGIEVEN